MITRHSKQRDALIEILKSTDRHPTADTLYMEMRKRFPNVSLATVYRNLRQLSECGEIMTIAAGTGAEHFDGNFNPHYHFVCRDCGNVFDIAMENMDFLNNNVSEKTGYEIETHSLLFYGKCKDCKN